MSTAANYGNILNEIQQSPKEVEYMEKFIKEHMRPDGLFVEWGSGGSTCKWLETLAPSQRLISIEHLPEWHQKVIDAATTHFDKIPSNFTYLLSVEKFGFKRPAPHPMEELGLGLDTYILPRGKGLENFWNADIYFVDGIARTCIMMMILLKNQNPNAAVFVHDYVGREEWYEWASQLYDVEIVGTTLARLHFKK